MFFQRKKFKGEEKAKSFLRRRHLNCIIEAKFNKGIREAKTDM